MNKVDENGVSSATAKLLGRDKITWWDVLWKYAGEFFVEDENCDCFNCGKRVRVPNGDSYGNSICKVCMHTEKIKSLLQQKKYEEADIYFRKNCVLISNDNDDNNT